MSQTEWVLKNAKRRWITAVDALKGCGCFRLAARIKDLRDQGYNIVTMTITKNGKRFAAYKLIGNGHGLR